jgi:hypothetical protein
MVAVLIEAIKELSAKVADLEAGGSVPEPRRER